MGLLWSLKFGKEVFLPMKKSKKAVYGEAVLCKFRGKKYYKGARVFFCLLLQIALVALYALAVEPVKGLIDGIASGALGYVVAIAAGIVGGIVVATVWSAIINLFAVPSSNRKEQKHYFEFAALRNQLDEQRTILAEGDARANKLRGRLYLTTAAVEYYADKKNNFVNYFLIPLYEVKKVKGKGKKLVIKTKMKTFKIKVARTSGKAWKQAIKKAVKAAK